MLHTRPRWGLMLAATTAALSLSHSATAAPPVPSGPHPRLFLGGSSLAAFQASAAIPKTAAARLVAGCDDTITNPGDYTTRGGSDGDNWPRAAMSCAFAYVVTSDAKYLTAAKKYWQASLDDDQTIGDHLGCVSGVATNWQSWNGNPPAPPIILTVTHDTGYPIRWYGPDIALTYDWLANAPGVDPLLAQTRTCLTAWVDYYSANGYHHDEAGANYNAGFVISKALAGVAIGNDGGADGHIWSQATDDLFPNLLVGQGLLGATGTVGSPAGPMVGGDWAEGWQYGPLSVLEYSVAARALAENGAPQPEMSAWADSLVVRTIHGTVPTLDGQWPGGDFDDTAVYPGPNVNELDAVLAGTTSDANAAWALSAKQASMLDSGAYFYNALAETRVVTPVDFRTQMPAPSRWYLARGTRAMYARTTWQSDALWAVFSSAPAVVSDHQHFSASSFVLSRGADHLVVDPSRYGEYDTLATNAVTAESDVDQGDYAGTQTPWSQAELLWARGTDDAVYAARSDFAKAFKYSDTPSDIPYAHREWVLLPEGEVVAIDRVHTADAAHAMTVGFHTNTSGTLAINGNVATGTVGGSRVAIHSVLLSGGTPTITQPEVGDCSLSCSYPCGQCDAARFAVDKYSVRVPGPWAVAVHVIDALGTADPDPTVGSMNDDTVDPAPKANGGVVGAAVNRSAKQSYVVASSATDGASPATMTYAVPGASASRHVVYDAPEDSNGKSIVTATPMGDRCAISIQAGNGFDGRPLLFQVASVANACAVTEDTSVPPGTGAGGSGTGAGAGGGPSSAGAGGGGGAAGSTGQSKGCGCRIDDSQSVSLGPLALAVLMGLGARLRRRS